MNPLPYDPALLEGLKTYPVEGFKTVESIRNLTYHFTAENLLQSYPEYEYTDHTIPGPVDNPGGTIILSVFKLKNSFGRNLPACYHVHGGGQIAGDRFAAMQTILAWFKGIDMVHVTVEYRLAPEHRAPAALNDSYAGLVWTADHANELGIDLSKLMIQGTSGGGPIAAGCAIKARDLQYPKLCAQLLSTPMMDDRVSSVSSKQYYDHGPWNGKINSMAWDCVLGNERNGPNVSELVSPARATDLAGVPPAFIDAGESEVFRDEAISYASVLWKSGVSAELHIWPGAYHGFDMLVPNAPVSLSATAARQKWIRRTFGIKENLVS
ncbi:Alpha/Beta hydrolase protein [Xylogone sp. PMI_703]|nr:Alpha/Beta hydrolase protein [Xylogone sp. PMI_703]